MGVSYDNIPRHEEYLNPRSMLLKVVRVELGQALSALRRRANRLVKDRAAAVISASLVTLSKPCLTLLLLLI